MMFNIEDYDYNLPQNLIAQLPASRRDCSRLLVVERLTGSFSDHVFKDLPGVLKPGDLLVVNNTRVVPARLFGRKESGGFIEILVLDHPDPCDVGTECRWCLCRSSKRPKKGSSLLFECGVSGRVEDFGEEGLLKISFHGPMSVEALMEKRGVMPLPPYIKRETPDMRSGLDRERYQTVFSRVKGAVAAPTAGLHFSEDVIMTLEKSGISLEELTLHVGLGTFRPVRTQDIRHHSLGQEYYRVDQAAADAVNRTKKEGGRVIAVGTTVVRTLETVSDPDGTISPGMGKTDLLVTPGFSFRVIDGLITNFHLPRSSLLFLVSAFAGRDVMRMAYRQAIEKEYRFYSYGDAMLII